MTTRNSFNTKNNRHAFTLIELLVVPVILGVLMSVAMPLYLKSLADSQRKVCRANMQTIANAVQATYVRTSAADYSTWIGSDPNAWPSTASDPILPDLQSIPLCPCAGTYSIVNGSTGTSYSFKIQCSFAPAGGTPHGTFELGVDSN